jgi:hypothetical protein
VVFEDPQQLSWCWRTISKASTAPGAAELMITLTLFLFVVVEVQIANGSEVPYEVIFVQLKYFLHARLRKVL